jgi:deoxyinosine 3'endonuclease (endonuclease V)
MRSWARFTSFAVYVILDEREHNLQVVYRDYEFYHLDNIPYISSYLAFREIDPIARLVRKQQEDFPQWTPCCILVDGNGIFHARRAGLACFVGVQCQNIATIGVGKSLYSYSDDDEQNCWCLTREMMNQSLDDTILQLEHELDTGQITATTPQDEQILLLNRRCLDPSQQQQQPQQQQRQQQQQQQQQQIIASNNSQHMGVVDRMSVLKRVAPFCRGIGVLLKARDSSNSDTSSSPSPTTLACALFGHGGRRYSSSSSSKHTATAITVGTKNPIYISVGHNMSLQDAVRIAARLSLSSRIPEPIRQADLMGRELLRQREQQER